MPRQFVFVEQVEKILKSGGSEIEIPEGARLSAAAVDLINAHKLKIQTVDLDDSAAQASDSAAEPIEKKIGSRGDGQEKTAPELTGDDSDTGTENEISEEMLEDIVNRVVLRFQQRKGIGPAGPADNKSGSAAQTPVPAPDDDLVICRCEEITKGTIKDAIRNGMQSLNGIKRVTRAGMGLCQGQTCQRLVIQILADELGLNPADIEPTTARGPVRPLRLAVYANR